MSELITPLSPQDLFTESSTQGLPLGAKGETKDGRQFRYVRGNSSTALVAGNLLQSPAQVANHLSLAVASAAAIGDTQVTVTLGGTAATANQYREGYLITSSTPGHGYSYKIKSHPAQSTTTGNVTLTLEDPLLVALTTSSTVDLCLNPYNNVIQSPTTETGVPVGVAQFVNTVSYYFWIQTRGVASVLSQGGTNVGETVVVSNGTAGAVETGADATDAQPIVGAAINTVSDTQNCAINLCID